MAFAFQQPTINHFHLQYTLLLAEHFQIDQTIVDGDCVAYVNVIDKIFIVDMD